VLKINENMEQNTNIVQAIIDEDYNWNTIWEKGKGKNK
jgi:hypothetical protein